MVHCTIHITRRIVIDSFAIFYLGKQKKFGMLQLKVRNIFQRHLQGSLLRCSCLWFHGLASLLEGVGPGGLPSKTERRLWEKKCSNLQPTCRNFQLETVLRANSHDRCFLCGRKTPPASQYKPVQNARSHLHFSIHAFVVHRLDPMIIEHLGESGPQCLTSIQPDKRQDRPKHDFPLSIPPWLCRWGWSLG